MDPKMIMRAGIRGAREKSMTLLGSAYQPVLTGTVVSVDGAFVTATVAGSGPVRLPAVAATYVAGQPVAVAVDGNSRPTYVLGPLVAGPVVEEVDGPVVWAEGFYSGGKIVSYVLRDDGAIVPSNTSQIELDSSIERIELPSGAVSVLAGREHSPTAITRDGGFYVWGNISGGGHYDLLGNPVYSGESPNRYVNTPTKFALSGKVVSGDVNSHVHLGVAALDDGTVWFMAPSNGWGGRGGWSWLRVEDPIPAIKQVRFVNGYNITASGSADSYALMVAEDGRLFSQGTTSVTEVSVPGGRGVSRLVESGGNRHNWTINGESVWSNHGALVMEMSDGGVAIARRWDPAGGLQVGDLPVDGVRDAHFLEAEDRSVLPMSFYENMYRLALLDGDGFINLFDKDGSSGPKSERGGFVSIVANERIKTSSEEVLTVTAIDSHGETYKMSIEKD